MKMLHDALSDVSDIFVHQGKQPNAGSKYQESFEHLEHSDGPQPSQMLALCINGSNGLLGWKDQLRGFHAKKNSRTFEYGISPAL
jgi:hypothetical protein